MHNTSILWFMSYVESSLKEKKKNMKVEVSIFISIMSLVNNE